CLKHEEITEMNDAISNFEQNYQLNHKRISFIIEKNSSEIAPYFVIYPEKGTIDMQKVLPLKDNYSYLKNTLIKNNEEMLIILDGTYFKILKSKPRN
ncbi:MAG TPA: hypothetical protein PK357_01390, partial [Candidatus Pacearchaeota archaeon]|nr:hypothetical protein [Candidatus Pacearchaeota archaeon]